MARPTKLERNLLSQGVRNLRIDLGETQEQFAARLGVSVVSVAKYETNHAPSSEILDRLTVTDEKAGRDQTANIFRVYQRTLRTDSEILVNALKTLADRATIENLKLALAVLQLTFAVDEPKLKKLENLLGDDLDAVDVLVNAYWKHSRGRS